ncbi:carbohydrate-binding protein [Rhizobium sp. SSA_523]|uniref:carbohydrate-binding protein n=1 Tax=Rhizobium sp. SSA_523 TaxID=2952477 RepID=UPI0020902BB1|nr:carbohydrate-binding protein [Rhizobium sp. SSA_523]MCO5732339.1 carbohydrate-binding protein [Rhizobium sp. SSA_523]WKC21261.1 carbohydrate-binding protein [Rhizobium sp. SSA_523]
MQLTLRVIDAAGTVKGETTGAREAVLVYREEYKPGDRLELVASQAGHAWVSLDAGVMPALLYLTEAPYAFVVPFSDARKTYAPLAFEGQLHRLQVRQAEPCEVAARRNLALNPFDQHGNAAVFPHAEANVETRGEAAFAARNAIDGERASHDHGFWPFTSWGINRDPEAALTLHFGRPVLLDEVVLYLRADFPHDAWWQGASISFSDGSLAQLSLRKSGNGQRFPLERRVVEWAKLHTLIKADDPSPYPALTQIEFWGSETQG